MSKEIMKEIEGNWNYERCIKPEHVGYLIEQNKQYREALEEIAEEVHLGGDSKYVTEEKLIRVIIRARKALEDEQIGKAEKT